jgi:hypothetical protein
MNMNTPSSPRHEQHPHSPGWLDPHAWMGRPVMWGIRGGVRHVVTNAAMVGRGVVQKLACGGATNLFGLTLTTYHGMKRLARLGKMPPNRFCRRCVKMLEAAGEDGKIGR